MNDGVRALYNAYKDNGKLSFKQLTDLGFTYEEINDLVSSNILKKNKNASFKVLSPHLLYLYGSKIYSKFQELAIQSFLKCLELDKTNKEAAFRLFAYYIEKFDIKKSIPYFEIYYTGTSENDYNSEFYLYLLNIIGCLPDKYVEYAKYLKYPNFKIPFDDTNKEELYIHNKVRMSCSNQKFTLAYSQIKEILNAPNNQTIENILIRNLLGIIIFQKSDLNNNLRVLIKSKKYKEALSTLEELSKKQNLKTYQEYLILLLNDIIYILTTGKIPTMTREIANTLEDAIKYKNYNLALKYVTDNLENLDFGKDRNLVYLLLTDIIDLIQKIEANLFTNEDIIEDFEEDLDFSYEEAESLDNKKKSKPLNKKDENNYLREVIYNLLTNNFPQVFEYLHLYLTSINYLEYEFLIVDLIKIDILEEKLTFKEALLALTSLTREDFKIDIAFYIIKYYEYLGHDKLEIASLYLDILKNFKKLGIEFSLLKEASKVLIKKEEK